MARLNPGATSTNVVSRIEAGAKALKIKLAAPWEKLSAANRALLMNGGNGFGGILAILRDLYENYGAGYREYLTEFMSPAPCTACGGKRLRPASLAVRVRNISIAEFTQMPLSRALLTVKGWEFKGRELQIAGRVVDEIRRRLEFLESVGLHYLSLDRSASTLSGGEAQRIRLATQIGSRLKGGFGYVLDEPFYRPSSAR